MKKKILIILIIVILIGGLLTYLFIKNNDSGTYEIQVELVDDRSPDRILKVLKDGKEYNNFKYIKYKSNNIILCYQKNPTVNMFELTEDELVIVLNDDKEVFAKIRKENSNEK